MPQHQQLLVPGPGPRADQRLETQLQPLTAFRPGLPTPGPLRCHLYPPMNDSRSPWTSSRGPVTRRHPPPHSPRRHPAPPPGQHPRPPGPTATQTTPAPTQPLALGARVACTVAQHNRSTIQGLTDITRPDDQEPTGKSWANQRLFYAQHTADQDQKSPDRVMTSIRGSRLPDLAQFSVQVRPLISARAARRSSGSGSAAVRICRPALMCTVR